METTCTYILRYTLLFIELNLKRLKCRFSVFWYTVDDDFTLSCNVFFSQVTYFHILCNDVNVFSEVSLIFQISNLHWINLFGGYCKNAHLMNGALLVHKKLHFYFSIFDYNYFFFWFVSFSSDIQSTRHIIEHSLPGYLHCNNRVGTVGNLLVIGAVLVHRKL